MRRPIGLALALLATSAASAQGSWVEEPATRQRLAGGEVVVQSATGGDAGHPHGRVRAAVQIKAAPEAIWAVITDCQQTPAFVPGLKGCRRVDRAPDGGWEEIEHEVRYSWLLPTIRYVFRARYEWPRRIEFRRVRGDLKEEEGSWLLSATPDGSATVVEYEMYLDPGFWIPRALVARSLRHDLPAALSGLRQRVESATAGVRRELVSPVP